MQSMHRYRRRRSPPASMATTGLLLIAGSLLGSVSGAALTEPLVPLDAATLTSNMRHWTADYAVMFYAPWCTHCKEAFMPLWEDVAGQMADEDPKGNRKLVMAKFNCEQDAAAIEFCHDINLQYYPTFVFYGAGKFHDYDPLTGMALGRPTEHDSSAKYPSQAMVYFDVMADWTKAMHLISRSNRFMEKFSPSRFWSRKDQGSSEERLLEEIEALERQNHQLQQVLTGGGASATAGGHDAGAEGGGMIYGFGDPYADLLAVSYDPQYEPVMMCVADLATEYCGIEGVEDPWCSMLEHCAATSFTGVECWPSSCPFQQEGCEIISYCMSPEVFEAYMEIGDNEGQGDGDENWAQGGEEEAGGDYWTWSEGETQDSDPAATGEAAAASGHAAASSSEQQGGGGAAAAAPALPPFFGRRAGGSQGGGGGGADERGEAVAGA